MGTEAREKEREGREAGGEVEDRDRKVGQEEDEEERKGEETYLRGIKPGPTHGTKICQEIWRTRDFGNGLGLTIGIWLTPWFKFPPDSPDCSLI